jgi:hypothetical protein
LAFGAGSASSKSYVCHFTPVKGSPFTDHSTQSEPFNFRKETAVVPGLTEDEYAYPPFPLSHALSLSLIHFYS